MSAPVVDEAGSISGDGIQLDPVRRPPFGQVELAVAAAEQPGARREPRSGAGKAPLQLGDAATAAEVSTVGGERVVDDMSMGVVEPREHARPRQLYRPCQPSLQLEDLAPSDGDDNAA